MAGYFQRILPGNPPKIVRVEDKVSLEGGVFTGMVCAGIGCALILGGLLLTFSRSAFLVLGSLLIPITYFRYLKPHHSVAIVCVVALFVGLAMVASRLVKVKTQRT